MSLRGNGIESLIVGTLRRRFLAGLLAAQEGHGTGCCHVSPPSAVPNTRPSAAVTEAWVPSAALTSTRSTAAGEEAFIQCSPSVVCSTIPACPTTQQTFADGAEPASSAAAGFWIC